MNPFFFGTSAEPLFGVFHPAKSSTAQLGLIRSRGHVPKGGYDVPNGSNHTSAVTPAIQ